jgi:hypothetical protein
MYSTGPGLLASDALMLGIDPNTQRDRMTEALDVFCSSSAARSSLRRPTGAPSSTRPS